MLTRLAIIVLAVSVALTGCRELSASADDAEESDTVFTLTSSAFAHGQPIPRKYAMNPEGENASPPLAWTGVPEGTLSFALIVDDPDAPSADNPRPEGPWVHWVAMLSGSTTELSEDYSSTADMSTQGRNDSGRCGYDGPFPPKGSGPHRYYFTLYALDVLEPTLGSDFSKADLLRAIDGHVLESTELMGTYER